MEYVWTLLIVFFAAMLLASGATQGIVRLARSLKLYDPRNARSVHTTKTPRIGGVAIFISLMVVSVATMIYDAATGDVFAEIRPQLIVLFATSAFIFLVGLVDDIRGMRALVKLAAQILAACVICAFGIRIGKIAQFGWWFEWFSWPITICWIVAITNAVNLIDGLDGLSAGICAATCAVIAGFSIFTGQPAMAILMLTLLGSLVGFLFFNFNPAKIFMGDSGSMFLGFFLATASIVCATKVYAIMGLLLPALALGLPIFDMLLSVVRRVLERRSVFSADRGHIHHRLLDKGLNHRNAVLVMYLVTLVIAGAGVLMIVLRDRGELIVFVAALLVLLAVFRVAGVLRFRKMYAQMQLNLARSREIRRDRKQFEAMQNRFRRAWTFEQWWRAVRRMARRMGFKQIVIHYRDSESGEVRTMEYNRPVEGFEQAETMHLSIPVGSQESDLLKVEIAVPVRRPLETIGRRISLFGRLLDEHSPTHVGPADKTKQDAAQIQNQ